MWGGGCGARCGMLGCGVGVVGYGVWDAGCMVLNQVGRSGHRFWGSHHSVETKLHPLAPQLGPIPSHTPPKASPGSQCSSGTRPPSSASPCLSSPRLCTWPGPEGSRSARAGPPSRRSCLSFPSTCIASRASLSCCFSGRSVEWLRSSLRSRWYLSTLCMGTTSRSWSLNFPSWTRSVHS